MKINIREENLEDYNCVYSLIKKAFEGAEHTDGDEHNLVNRLRSSENYIEELSLVALDNDIIVGHIMFTKLLIINGYKKYESLALAPLSILPNYQNKGIGSKLINEGLKRAKALGYNSVIVLGSEKYYPRFGFVEASSFGIEAPFEVPSENFMTIELIKNSLKDVNGKVMYAKEFFEQQ